MATKPAHIQNRPDLDVGDKTIGICGTEFKVKVLFEDLPEDHPICRRCVETAVEAMNDATTQIYQVAAATRLVSLGLAEIEAHVVDEDSMMIRVIEATDEYTRAQEEKAQAKAEKKQAKKDRKKEAKRARKENEKVPVAPPSDANEAALREYYEKKDERWDEKE